MQIHNDHVHTDHGSGGASAPPGADRGRAAWAAPRFEVISLDCEITSYAPDGDVPLF